MSDPHDASGRVYDIRICGAVPFEISSDVLEKTSSVERHVRTVLRGRFDSEADLFECLRRLRAYGLEVVEIRRTGAASQLRRIRHEEGTDELDASSPSVTPPVAPGVDSAASPQVSARIRPTTEDPTSTPPSKTNHEATENTTPNGPN